MINMEEKFISCRVITYGRVVTLEETIQSFLQQDYPKDKCELILVNDYPLQKLEYNHPQIKIFNREEMFSTLGEKENFAIEQCQGNIICIMDDDDLYLPNHLSNINKYFTEGTDLLHWNRAIYMNWPKIEAITAVGNSGIVYSKKIWKQIGGYPKEQAGYDMSFVLKIKSTSPNIVFATPPDNEVSAIYVWGNRSYHCSGAGTDTPDRPNILQRHSAHIESLRKQGKIPTGRIELKPNWKYPYDQLLKDYIKNGK